MPLSPKWIALVALILQNSGLAILMRYTMISVQVSGDRYLASTAVLTAEIMKLAISVTLCLIIDCNMSHRVFLTTLYNEFIVNRSDWLKLMVPSILYTLQNSLQYFSMSRLSAPVFQVLYQLKIVTTAIFSVTLLSRRITALQWLSVVMLTGKLYYFLHSCAATATPQLKSTLARILLNYYICLAMLDLLYFTSPNTCSL